MISITQFLEKILAGKKLEGVSRKLISFYQNFLYTLSGGELEKVEKVISELKEESKKKKEEIEKNPQLPKKEKKKILEELIANYRKRFFASLSPESKKRFQEGIKEILEKSITG